MRSFVLLTATLTLTFSTIFLTVEASDVSFNIDSESTGTSVKDVENRVTALLQKMSLKEKLGQLHQLSGDAFGNFDPVYFNWSTAGELGSVINVRGAKNVNMLQRAAMESRLGIPLLFAFDVIHGYRTLFPMPLGEAASWDLHAAEQSAAIAAEEASSAGVKWVLAPMVDISRDPRWGRVMESSGEDIFLGMKMAEARIRGFQGTNYQQTNKVLACAKHFAAYGAAEAGREYNTVDVSERRLREVYLPPFKAALDAGAGSFMTAFNELNGVPATANKLLLRRILRDEWKFDGIVISDWNSVLEMIAHGFAATESEAAMLALNAGTDMEMNSGTYSRHGENLINSSKVSMKTLDDAVGNVLRIKLRLGLFDNPYVDEDLQNATLLKREFLEAARCVSSKSFVLLKNDRNTLPIKVDNMKELTVIGALADDRPNTLDWWPGDARAEDSITILQGINDTVATLNTVNPVKVTFEKGCESLCESSKDFPQAIQAATQADFTVIVVGETREISGEAGSRANIDLPGLQLDLIMAIAKTGKPYVVVIKNGRPLTLNWLAENAPAILITWHSGTMVGPAVADVLFGKVNPSGKLPMTFPRNVGQIPIHYDQKSTGRPFNANDRYTSKYVDSPNTPLYPFGFGLSYTTFKYESIQLGKAEIGPKDAQTVTVEIMNIGSREGTEVVQLYIRDPAASITRPVKQLRGFERVPLKAGEKREVTFILESEDFGFLGEDMKTVVEPGVIQVSVGGSSETVLSAQFSILATTQTASRPSLAITSVAITLIFGMVHL